MQPIDFASASLHQLRYPTGDMVMRNAEAIHYLNPSAILLFKAKGRRSKDQSDFEKALPKLPPSERLWLKDCLKALHAGHEGAWVL